MKDTIFHIHFIRQVHLAGDGGEDETFLPSVGQWEFNLAVQAAGSQKGRI